MVKIPQGKISIYTTFHCYLEKPASIKPCFPLPLLHFPFQTSDKPISTNRLQVIENKPDETLYAILIIKSYKNL